MLKSRRRDDRDVLLLAMNRLSERETTRFVVIIEQGKEFSVFYSDQIEDSRELINKAAETQGRKL